MPWRQPSIVPFTRIGIVCHVPSNSGVFGIFDRDVCLYVGDTWNLRGRLLELANALAEPEGLSIVWENCAEDECAARRCALEQELLTTTSDESARRLPGIQLRSEPLRRTA
jgi:hypothetical protein